MSSCPSRSPDPGDTFKAKEPAKTKSKLFGVYGILGLIGILFLFILIILCIVVIVKLNQSELKYEEISGTNAAPIVSEDGRQYDDNRVRPTRESPESSWHDDSCQSMDKCSNDRQPPLVIFSFDGFSKKYLERGIMKSLEKFAKCGVRAEEVFPSYPSKTFPNHYTIATGLYPESHGIVDNIMFVRNITPKVEDIRRTKYNEFYLGDPIWNVYKRQTGQDVACLFWAGCSYNISGNPKPKYSPPYDKNLPFSTRFEMVRNWLKSDEQLRLILAYFDQPDGIGHEQGAGANVDVQLEELNTLLDQFFTDLHSDGLLDCTNIVILSDHGMQDLNHVIDLNKTIHFDGVAVSPGAVARLYNNQTNLSPSTLAEPFECHRQEGVRVFTRDTMPTRKHHSAERVGDVILQGVPGVGMYTKGWQLLQHGDHGYDFLTDTMRTIFFARGPSIKRGEVVPRFQNIEYMNLWFELLGIEGVPTNGTKGFMDRILMSPTVKITTENKSLEECPAWPVFNVSGCGSCDANQVAAIESHLRTCPNTSNTILRFASDHARCEEHFCDTTVLRPSGTDESIVVLEELNRDQLSVHYDCSIYVGKYATKPAECNRAVALNRLSANSQSMLGRLIGTEFNASIGFYQDFLEPLNRFTLNYVKRYKKVQSISGLAYDIDHNGVADVTRSGPPTHFFRSLIRCQNNYDALCKQYETISFIFPIVDKDLNCLASDDLLLEYSARLKDVELISGLKWIPSDISIDEQLRVLSSIATHLY